MKRLLLSLLLLSAFSTAATPEALSPDLNCKEIFRRCANDCREVFDIEVLQDACTVGCFIGYMHCD